MQVHGHDFHAVAEIPQRSGGGAAGAAWRYLYASASEEKVVRVFAAPRVFVRSLAALRQVAWEDVALAMEGDPWDAGVSAAAPALGLSNKAVREGDEPGAAHANGDGRYPEGPDIAPAAAAKVMEVRAQTPPWRLPPEPGTLSGVWVIVGRCHARGNMRTGWHVDTAHGQSHHGGALWGAVRTAGRAGHSCVL